MNRRIMEDIQSTQRARVTRIPRPTAPAPHEYSREISQKISSNPRVTTKSKKPKTVLFLAALIALILGLYFICNKEDRAHVTVDRKQQSFTLNKMPFNISSNSNAKIHFELMIISDSTTQTANFVSSRTASEKAQGMMTLYNEFSTVPQKLLTHTFVSDLDGKAYLTDTAVTIPGYTTVDAHIVPGQVDVSITAFLTGALYNGSPTDFSLNGFKGTPKATKIYGKLKSPLAGGAEGVVYTLEPDDKGKLDAYATTVFKSNLLKKAYAELPPGYLLYPDAMNFSYHVDDAFLSKTPTASVSVTGSISAIILNQADLSNAILANLLPSIRTEELKEIEISDIQKIVFNFIDPNQIVSKDLTTVAFTLGGTVNLIWHPDTEALRSNLIAKNKSELSSVFQSDPGIANASARIFPPWQNTMPERGDKIIIDVH